MGYRWMSDLHYYLFMVVSCFLLLFMVVIIVDNTLIIAAPVLCKVLRTPDNLLMVSLAFADLTFGLVSIPIFILSKNDDHWVYFSTLGHCYMYQLTKIGPMALSLNMLELMAIDRYIAVFYPFRYIAQTKKNQLSCCASFAVWFVSAILVAIGYLGFKYDRSLPLIRRCNYIDNFAFWWQSFIIAHLLISILTCSLLTVLVVKKVQKMEANNSIALKTKSDVNVNVYLLLVFLVFWGPTAIIAPLATGSNDTNVHLLAEEMVFILGALNASSNALVYAFCRETNARIYKLLLHTWPWRWRRVKRQLSVEENRRYQMRVLKCMTQFTKNRDKNFVAFIEAQRLKMDRRDGLENEQAPTFEAAESSYAVQMPKFLSTFIGYVRNRPPDGALDVHSPSIDITLPSLILSATSRKISEDESADPAPAPSWTWLQKVEKEQVSADVLAEDVPEPNTGNTNE